LTETDRKQPTLLNLLQKGIYPTNEDAIASYNEIASVNAKLTTNEPVTAVNDAINQICAKHGVI
jgi:hypothetical protein